jgi:bifunctional enzyme CysN/CysC
MNKELIRLLISGSVDDGKSTLLGKLLYETNHVYKDQYEAIKNESKKYGTHGSKADLALLIDGLQDEREQGITIDVAYRYFESPNKKFIIADTPGHKQYTKNMATAASNSQIAVILIDVRNGITDQTRLHSFIISLFKLENIIVLINKMDLINFNQRKFNIVKDKFEKYLSQLNFKNNVFIPISALTGDNIVQKSNKIKWYKGESLLKTLDKISVKENNFKNFRMPIQWVNRSSVFRGYSGSILSGKVKKGDIILVEPSQKTTQVKKIYHSNKESFYAIKDQSVTITTKDELDISRGDCFCFLRDKIESYSLLDAKIFWIDRNKLILKKKYKIQFYANEIEGVVSTINFKYDLKTFNKKLTKSLEENEIGLCKVSLSKKIPMELYSDNKTLGSFIIIDIITNDICGVGIIENLIKEKNNLFWQKTEINKLTRAKLNSQKPCVLWFTGLSASGKSTLANLVEKKLYNLNKKTYLLDGDNIRQGLNKDLSFSDKDRKENIRRIAEVSKLMLDAGLIVLTAFISPFKSERFKARNLTNRNEFIEIFVKASLKTCEKRDPKGLYKKARLGKIKKFTGISSKYEQPNNPEITLDTEKSTPEYLANKVINYLKIKKII